MTEQLAQSPWQTWRTRRHWERSIPSLIASLAAHALLLVSFLWISQSGGCEGDLAGEPEGDYRTVGLVERESQAADAAEDTPAEESSQPDAAPTETASEAVEPSAEPLLPDLPPLDLDVPLSQAPPLLGSGLPGESGHSGGVSVPATSGTPGSPGNTGNPVASSTSMFGIPANGKRFVYVIDRSGSMQDYGAMRVALAELKASLEQLTEDQFFQVIFYNTRPIPLEVEDRRIGMFRGRDADRFDAIRQFSNFPPGAGTRHMPALEMAFTFQPDVIYFLTDADDPALTPAELERVVRLNRSGARIHCIEFDIDAPEDRRGLPPNFLQKLAQQNDGRYEYRDVRRFR